ncbi:hypothetical protein NHN26_01135 [Rhodovulum tesquicola]|uniref:hypothetical protein n=1 Tax=Rhodovulum tesquicola TaxID=540254 RepID=UPI0020975D6F|nr:hypothetical protein [Rhodovulum tesquicola]MCO8143815.1 hypothetical protein [Rhodovulum tesquicola]
MGREDLEELLEREAEALRLADFAALAGIADEKERLAADLAAEPETDADSLARLRALAERNADLLEAVRRGVDSAAETLRRAREPAAPLSTYDKSGQCSPIGATQGSLTRRA